MNRHDDDLIEYYRRTRCRDLIACWLLALLAIMFAIAAMVCAVLGAMAFCALFVIAVGVLMTAAAWYAEPE